jgi:hypothetical protein
MSTIRYSIWRDGASGDYEVVRWEGHSAGTVVQTNIRTREKAATALADWQMREYTLNRMRELDAMELELAYAIAKLDRDNAA